MHLYKVFSAFALSDYFIIRNNITTLISLNILKPFNYMQDFYLLHGGKLSFKTISFALLQVPSNRKHFTSKSTSNYPLKARRVRNYATKVSNEKELETPYKFPLIICHSLNNIQHCSFSIILFFFVCLYCCNSCNIMSR